MKPSIPILAALVASLPLIASTAPTARVTQDDDLQAFGGRWLYVEDITEGRPREQQGPPMMVTFGLRVEEEVVVLERTRSEEPFPINGAVETPSEEYEGYIRRVRGSWKDGVLAYESDYVRTSDEEVVGLLRREFRILPEGLQVTVLSGDRPPAHALYCHPEDIPAPTPAKATIDDMQWLGGTWVGAKGTSSTEERWTPAGGGAMLGISRTIQEGQMRQFEYLRIVERDGGLVYVAQPGGSPPTEFVLTELDGERAVFDNPRHDYPQRIVYELSIEGTLGATIGFINGGSGTRFEFQHEGEF